MQASGLEEILDCLYMSAADPVVWPQFLNIAAAAFDARIVGLLAQVDADGRYAVAGALGICDQTVQAYNGFYAKKDPWYLALRERGIREWTGRGTDLCPLLQFQETEFYNDFWKTSAPGLYQAGIILQSSSGSAVFTMHRERCQPDFDENSTQLLRLLAPHLRRALSVHRKVSELRESLAGAGGVVDALDIGLIGLSGAHRVCFANAVAESLLASADSIRLKDGRLTACDPAESLKLESLIRHARSRLADTKPGGSITVGRRSRPLHITVFPVAGARGIVPEDAHLFLTISDAASRPKSREHILAGLFHLTPSEIRTVMMLVAGMEPSEIAVQTQTTAGTVRFQLKMVYRKMGVGRQSRLVRLVSQLPGV